MANPGKSRLETERPAAEGGVNIALPGGDLGKHLTLMAVGLVAWILMYRELAGLSQWITYDVFGLAEGAALGSSVQFFTYDAPKVLMLLTLVVFGVGIMRTFFTPERTRAILAGRRKVAALYLVTGLSVAILSGIIIGRLGLERWVEPWVYEMQTGEAGIQKMGWTERIEEGWEAVKDIVGRVWPYMLVGIAVGAAIHGYVPQDAMASIMGREAWWSVPAAVILGIPLYTNAAGMIPIVEALLSKGAALGTALAFMMAVIALSFPEFVILRKVLRPGLIGVLVGVVGGGILLVGYLFNLLNVADLVL